MVIAPMLWAVLMAACVVALGKFGASRHHKRLWCDLAREGRAFA
jgi:hypothetical protein